jgi:prepilin-type N-terminal cleavage/methylation domain-containing protein
MHVMSALVRPFRSQRGFSLAELLVVCAVLGLLMAGLLVIQTGGSSAYVIGSSRVAAQQNARVALEMMVRELRSAQRISAFTGSTDIEFKWEDNAVPPVLHTIRYQLAGGVINRTEDGVPTPLIGGVTFIATPPHRVLFTCYSDFDNSTGIGTLATAPKTVRLIRIHLETGSEITVGSNGDANQHATMESWVRLRNCLPSLDCI